MSTASALVMHGRRLPSTDSLVQAVAADGCVIAFPSGFSLSQGGGWVDVRLDGVVTGFDYAFGHVADLDDETTMAELVAYGDSLLSFETRGFESSEAVAVIQRALAAHWDAAGWIDGELVAPEDLARPPVPEAVAPEVAALVAGTLAERKEAQEACVAQHAAPLKADRAAHARNALKPLTIPALLVIAFGAIFAWTSLT